MPERIFLRKVSIGGIIILCFLLLSGTFFLSPAAAQRSQNSVLLAKNTSNNTNSEEGLKSAGEKLKKIAPAYGAPKTFEETIGGIIKIALSLLGVIFLLLTVYGGYLWMTAREEEETVRKAKNIISRAITGLIIVLAAYALTYFVIARLMALKGG